MCWGCRPMCDSCKPPLYFSVTCPSCGLPVTTTREEYLMYFNLPHRLTDEERRMRKEREGERPFCPSCGADVTDVVRDAITPQPGLKSGIVCGYPCGQRTIEPRPGMKRCDKMVPLERVKLL